MGLLSQGNLFQGIYLDFGIVALLNERRCMPDNDL